MQAPYDLRDSFASLLLTERRQELCVARQLGHSLAVLLSTYARVIDEYEDAEHVDAEAEIAKARSVSCASELRASKLAHDQPTNPALTASARSPREKRLLCGP